jgi:hypothetical protein
VAVARHHTFIRDEILPSWWANAIQVPLSVLAQNFHVRRQAAASVRVPAGPGEDVAAISIDGRWRWAETAPGVDAAHPGGAAGLYRVWATAKENNIVNAPDPNTDLTDYSFGLVIRSNAAGPPPVVAGVVDLFVEVANLDWDGAQITALRQSRGSVAGAQLEDGTFTAGTQITCTRQPDGSYLFSLVADGVGAVALAPGAVTDAEVNAAAAIAESKLALASDAAAGTPSRRTLGAGALQAAAGNDGRFPAGVDIVNADIAAAAAIAESKLALASDAAAGTPSRRTLGAGALQAAAGNDARLSDTRTPSAGSITDAMVAVGAAIAMSKLALSITNAEVNAAAAIAESKLNLASDAVAGTASRRTLGAGAQQATAGNDARLSDTRTPTDATVTNAKVAAAAGIVYSKLNLAASLVNADIAAAAAIAYSKLNLAASLVNADVAVAAAIAESKLSLASDAVAGTASRRTLGVGAQQAAAGNDSRLSDTRTPSAASIVDSMVNAAAAIAMSKLALSITNAEVNAAAAIAESKLNLASDAAAGTASRRTLGTGAAQAAPGDVVANSIGNRKLLCEGTGYLLGGDTPNALIYILQAGGSGRLVQHGVAGTYIPAVAQITAAELAVAGKTPKLQIEILGQSNSSLGLNIFTARLYSILSSGAGGANTNSFQTNVGQTTLIALGLLGGSNFLRAISGDFTIPADGQYVLGLSSDIAVAANAFVSFVVRLWVRWV